MTDKARECIERALDAIERTEKAELCQHSMVRGSLLEATEDLRAALDALADTRWRRPDDEMPPECRYVEVAYTLYSTIEHQSFGSWTKEHGWCIDGVHADQERLLDVHWWRLSDFPPPTPEQEDENDG